MLVNAVDGARAVCSAAAGPVRRGCAGLFRRSVHRVEHRAPLGPRPRLDPQLDQAGGAIGGADEARTQQRPRRPSVPIGRRPDRRKAQRPDNLGFMRCSILALVVLIGATDLPAAGDEIRVIYDQRPEADIPPEARGAGTTPDPDAKSGRPSNITFGIVTDLRDYGPLRNVMPRDVHAVTVRYYDGSFKDVQEVQRYLTSVLRTEKGSTTTYCPWAESLPVPAVEATIQFASGEKGRLLLWRQGRLVYQDPGLKWWFVYGW